MSPLPGAFDSTVHMSEEALNAEVAIPYAIILACTSSGILGWGTVLLAFHFTPIKWFYAAINVALAFFMGNDPDSIINSPIGQPVATVCYPFLWAFEGWRFSDHCQDSLQLLWYSWHAGSLGVHYFCTVCELCPSRWLCKWLLGLKWE